MSTLEQRASAKDSRRRQVERRLAELGWKSRPWFAGAVANDTAPEPRSLFEELGPVFAACGLHLASRLDLLPEEDCWRLAAIVDHGTETPPEAVEEILRGETEAAHVPLVADFEPVPSQVRLLSQSHRGRAANGEEVTIEIVHPEILKWLDEDLDALDLVAAPLAARALPCSEARVDDALATARRALRDAATLGPELIDGEEAEESWTPKPLLETPQLRVMTGWSTPLAEVLEAGVASDAAADLARHLWLRWLWQVLRAGRIPIDPSPESLAVVADRWPLFGAVGSRLRPQVQEKLGDYLAAMTVDDPDAACDALLGLVSPRPAADRHRLRRRLRQLMPFRDSRRLDDGDTVAATLLLHQRLLAEGGFQPAPPLAELYRSLFWIHCSASRLVPDREILAEALEELRLVTGLGELRRQLDMARLAQDLKQNASLWLELPQKLDAVLTRAARETAIAEAGHSPPPAPRERRSTDASLAVVALLAAAVALAVVGRRLVELGADGVWGEELAALALLLLGAWFLHLVGRGRR